MKVYKIIKFIFYILLGVLILIFNAALLEYVPFLVGSIMILYGVEDTILKLFLKEFREDITKSVDNFLIIMLGIIMFFLNKPEHFVPACIIWATWSILREEWEIKEKAIEQSNSLVIAIINVIESIVLIVFSILLIFSPTEHHAHVHIILLGIELMLEVIFPVLDEQFSKLFPKSKLLENIQEKEKEL